VKIAFGICSLGIGHAIRSAPIIEKLIKEGHEVVIISYDRAAHVLKKEFPGIKIYKILDYPIQYPEKAHHFLPYAILKSTHISKSVLHGHKEFLRIHKKENFDIVLSDSRFDVFYREIPSFLIMHQLRIMVPLKTIRGTLLLFNNIMAKYFKKILVPDFEEDSLSGDLSHNLKIIDGNKIEYIGPLSPFKHRPVPKDIDVLISISGPEPQRTIFERKVLESVHELNGNVFITLGKPEKGIQGDGVKIYPYLTMKEREEIMNRSKLVISRSGYSTIMDLCAIGGKAMFVPTPGQPEQEYLARYLEKKGIAGYMTQDELDLKEIISKSKNYRGFTRKYDASKSVENVMRVISEWK
jgi:uncharacterized protein (TIGR00661 family)